jgi:nitrite reductase/ring-hydroxylating ferredoxin subunit
MVTTVDDALVAFPGVCPHDDVSLVDYGVMEDGHVMRCRVHGYRFDVRDGHCEHAPQLHLRRYKVTIVRTDGGDDLWVDLL